MIRTLFNDYLLGWSFSSIKQSYNNGSSLVAFVAFLPAILLCSLLGDKSFNSLSDVIMYMAILLPTLFSRISIILHPIRLGKMHYLIPQTMEDRKKQMKLAYYFQVVFHMIIFVIGIMIVFSLGHFNILSLIHLILNDIILSSVISVDDKNESAFYCVLFLLPICVITSLSQLIVVSNDEEHFVLQIVLYVVFVLIQLPLFLKHRKYILKQFQTANRYEEAIG